MAKMTAYGPGVARESRFARDALIAFATVLTAQVAGAMGGVLNARLLGPEGKGVYTVLFLTGILLGAVATLGTDLWASKECARRGYQASMVAILRHHGLVATMVVSIGGIAVGLLLVPLLSQVDGWTFAATLALALSSVWFVLGHAPAKGRRDLSRWFQATAISGAVYLVGVALLILSDRRSIALVLVAAILGRLVSLVAVPWKELPRPTGGSAAAWATVVRQHWTASLGTLVEVAAYRFDLLLIAWFVSAEEIGLYAVALPLAEVLWLVPNALSQVLLPATAAKPSVAVTARTVRIALVSALGIGAVLAAFSAPIVGFVFGAAYRPAAEAVPILVVASVILTIWKLVSSDLLARGLSGVRASTGLLGVATMLLALVILTPPYGIVGAALASVLGYSVSTIAVLVRWRAITGARLMELVPGRRDDMASLRKALASLRAKGEG